MLVHCAAYPWHRSAVVFGIGLAILEEADNLDGAVARVTGTTSRLGAYLDATTDRYKDIAAIGVVGWVHDAPLAAFLAATGALLTSYHKARAGMEVTVDNAAWPDLFERFERVALLSLGMVVAGLAPDGRLLGVDVAVATLWVLAVGSHLTGLQRLGRGAAILRDR